MKPGYKQTEVGVIPEDWEVVATESIIKDGPRNGWSARCGERGQGTPTLSLSATTTGRLILDDDTIKYLEQRVKPGSWLFLKKDDVLVQRSNTIDLVGTTAVFDGPKDTFVYPDLLMRIRFADPITAQWFWRYANSVGGRRYFRSNAAGSTGSMPKLSGGHIRAMPLPLPPLAEQEAIAGALSDADALIDSLAQLIAKKRRIKQGAMQDLLTGKRRLPGFEGEWEVKRLGDFAPLQRGFDLPNRDLRSGAYPVVYSNGVMNYHAAYQVKGPGVVTGRSGTIGNVTFVESDFWPHNTALWVTSFKSCDPKFVFFLYGWIGLKRFSSGSGVPTLNRNDAHDFSLLLPSIQDEQTAIAAILSDMDAEIAALEAKLSKARQVKQGMMQELLTGKTRLI